MFSACYRIVQRNLSIMNNNLPLHELLYVISGPSGTGKSTLIKNLMKEFPNIFGFSVSHTTRKPRPGEVDGVHYNFVTRGELISAIESKQFIEHAEFSGNIYGTSRRAVADVLSENKICILDVDMQGVKNIKISEFQAVYIFIRPPSMQVLEKRLRSRGTETEQAISKRLKTAEQELVYGEGNDSYNHIIINDNLTDAYEKLREVFLPAIESLKLKKS